MRVQTRSGIEAFQELWPTTDSYSLLYWCWDAYSRKVPATAPIRVHLHGAREMAHQAKALAAKTYHLGLVAGTYRIGENWCLQFALLLPLSFFLQISKSMHK